MSDQKPIKQRVGRRTIAISGIGPDIDLDQEAVYLADGTRLTEELAEDLGQEMAAEVERRRAGRPSISGGAVRTPSLTIRLPALTRQRLEVIAKQQHRRLADVSRDALAEYAAQHSPARTAAAPAKATKKAIGKKVAAVAKPAVRIGRAAKVPAKATAKATATAKASKKSPKASPSGQTGR